MLTAPVIRIVLDQATWIGFHLIALHDPFDSGFTVHDVQYASSGMFSMRIELL